MKSTWATFIWLVEQLCTKTPFNILSEDTDTKNLEVRTMTSNGSAALKNPESPQTIETLKVLVVDDSILVRSEVKKMLAGSPYEIIEAADGFEGLAQAQKNPDIGLVILDVNMPNMDGLTMAQKLHANRDAARLKKVPIVMLTTETSKELVLKAKAIGISGWIVKPPQKGTIISLMQAAVANAKK